MDYDYDIEHVTTMVSVSLVVSMSAVGCVEDWSGLEISCYTSSAGR